MGCNNNELKHWGVLGMKWGRRRYQNKDGSLTAEGKKRYGDPDSPEAKAKYEADKQKALKSGSATDVLKFKGDLSQQEMKSAMERIRWEQDMKGISDKEIAAGKITAEKVFNVVGKTTEYINTGAKMYNTFANIYNAFSGKGVSLPKIDTNITSGNKKERAAEKKEQKKVQEAEEKRREQEAQRETKQKERAEKRANADSQTKAESKTTINNYTIYGEGNSKGSNPFGKSKRDTPVYDVDFTNDVVSSVPAVYKSTGSAFAKRLLERNK